MPVTLLTLARSSPSVIGRGQVGVTGLFPGGDDVGARGRLRVEGRQPRQRVAAVSSRHQLGRPEHPGARHPNLVAARHDHRLGHQDPADPEDLCRGNAGEADACTLAHQAVRAVAACQVPGPELIAAARAADIKRDRVLVLRKARELVPAPDDAAQLAEPLTQALLKSPLRDCQHLQRAVAQPSKLQLHRPERERGHRARIGGAVAEQVQEPAVIEHLDTLSDDAVALRDLADLAESFQHDWLDSGQAQLDREHQPSRAAADDDDVCSLVHRRQYTLTRSVRQL